ncbi:hypothetical protein GQ53DRAFT_26825 [Thozetella sp. PMI_491]|nr:hypothetical protein GQ53DRAFT_26825 [Thozetella sp. PMI_491]
MQTIPSTDALSSGTGPWRLFSTCPCPGNTCRKPLTGNFYFIFIFLVVDIIGIIAFFFWLLLHRIHYCLLFYPYSLIFLWPMLLASNSLIGEHRCLWEYCIIENNHLAPSKRCHSPLAAIIARPIL